MMRFRTRAFLLCFVPFAMLLGGSFWMIQRLVEATVRNGLLSSLAVNQVALAQIQSKTELQNSRFLKVVGENAALKAGVQLLLFNPKSHEALLTVEDQLRDLCVRMGFDLLLVSNPEGQPLTGVIRESGNVTPLDLGQVHVTQRGLLLQGNHVWQVASVPVDQGEENLGTLSVGENFDFAEFTTPTVLLHQGKVVQSSLPGVAIDAVDAALRACGPEGECTVSVGGFSYISLPSVSFGDGYVLRSLQNVDIATVPVQHTVNIVFATVASGAVLVALVFSFASSRSIVLPISYVVEKLTKAARTGELPEFRSDLSDIREIRQLTESFNRAGAAVRESRASLHLAYVEFVRSLASALDARDKYTAGHSHRVSDLSCAMAAALGLGQNDVERIRIGALLHDIGKIGVSDTVLQKPGRLTEAEFALIREHPEMGRRILEKVLGFSDYLPAVELHHENWDGTGYPHGQSGTETPVDARIIHVADAYDAMTTDRPYRRGMTHDQAIDILRENAGTQFDAEIVNVFAGLTHQTGEPVLAHETSAV